MDRKSENVRKKFLSRYLYLNYRRFHGDIEQYGYTYSWKNTIFSSSIAILVAVFLGILYKLSWVGLVVLSMVCLLLMPCVVVNAYRKAYELKKFSDANKYMEKLLYYFKSSRKILTALVDMQKIFPSGRMSKLLKKAIDHIQQGDSLHDVREEALKIIESEYGCGRMRTIHSFIFNAELNGGDCNTSIDLLLEDRRLWAGRNVELQKKKQSTLRNTVIALTLTALMCVFTLYLTNMLPEIKGMMDISDNPLVQITSIFFIILLLVIFIKAYEKSSIDWLSETDGISKEKAFRQFEELSEYDGKRHLANGIAWSVIPFAIAFFLFLKFRSPLIILAGVGGILFMLNEYRIGYRIMLKKYQREVEKAFPEWLLGIVLLLNTESVPVAIRKSLDTAPNALVPAIVKMLEELDANPASEYPYYRFLGFLNLPDVQEVMATLYSIVNGSGGDVEDEFRGILDHVFRMMDKSESLKNEDKAAVLEIYIMLPALVGAVKLMADMSVLLISLFQIQF